MQNRMRAQFATAHFSAFFVFFMGTFNRTIPLFLIFLVHRFVDEFVTEPYQRAPERGRRQFEVREVQKTERTGSPCREEALK